jgi:phytoene desaturase
MSKKKAVVIGAGFAGMSAACYLAKDGFDVTVLEKNEMAGGRARKFDAEGFVFDMGPSWYWMPDIFEKFFADFGKKPSDYYQLKRLSPSYSVYFDDGKAVKIPSDMQELKLLFEQYEKGSGEKLEQFLNDAAYKYNVGINDLVHKPGVSLLEFASIDLMRDVMRLNVFKSFYKHAREYFSHPHLLQLLEFPVLFLGATAQNTPALYSLMNYADMQLGTWYPMGGMFEIVKGMKELAESLGVNFVFNSAVTNFEYNNNGNINSVSCNSTKYEADVVIGSADYNFLDTQLLKEKRNYSDKYWNNRTMAPSCLLFYLGIDKKVKNLEHHNLFFDKDFTKHAFEIYEEAKWPSDPLFYVCAPSKTDKTVAPEGKENLFLLMPVAIGLEDNEQVREKYYHIMMDRLENLIGEEIRQYVIYKKSYAQSNFISDYNSFKGNAYGLANTLKQTAILKPSIRSKKVKNLFFSGQLTVPGPGVPPSLISGKVAAALIRKEILLK